MVYQGKDNNCFGEQQHGSRPQHQAMNVVHMKMLTYDLTRILRLSFIMFHNDATGCFDCIFVSLAMISALRLAMSRLSKLDTFIFHQSMYIPSMTYSLLALTFDTKTLNKIQSKAVQAILNKLWVSKSFPQRVAFGPKDMCGMALLDMSVEQGI
jgi:hypothetical protein